MPPPNLVFGVRATPVGALPLTRPSPPGPGPLQLAGDRVAEAAHSPLARAGLGADPFGEPVEELLRGG
jgi:hypothetical protein